MIPMTFSDLEYHFTVRRKASFVGAAHVCATENPSVCLFVCPSHSDIVSKRGNAEGCGLHHRVAQCL